MVSFMLYCIIYHCFQTSMQCIRKGHKYVPFAIASVYTDTLKLNARYRSDDSGIVLESGTLDNLAKSVFSRIID